MTRLNRVLLGVLVLSFASLAGCADEPEADDFTENDSMEDMSADTMLSAMAQLEPTAGNNVTGIVRFAEVPGGVRITADISGLGEGQHGFHVHENGDCSAPDASSAGGHFNPTGAPHGAPTDPAASRHVGDLGNLEADASGNASYERIDNVITLEGANAIVGKAVIVHSDADDLESQPTGNAGDRLACGIITTDTGMGRATGNVTDI